MRRVPVLIFSIPFGAFLALFGLLWNTPPIEPPVFDEFDEDPAQAELDYHKALRRRARIAVLRLAMLSLGVLILVGNLFNILINLGDYGISDAGDFLLLTVMYGLGLLLVQRVEPNRRLITLVIIGFVGLIVRRYALFRDLNAELTWAVFASLLLNYLFWVTIGRRYPPRSSTDIRVWGMDMTD
jgi:hypothetical protein